MRFPLKHDYFIEDSGYHRMCKGVLKIKEGAPIWVAVDWHNRSARNFDAEVRFSFAEGMLSIGLNDLVLPEKCGKDEWGTVFCATNQDLCYLGGHHDQDVRHALSANLRCCPRCGSELQNLSSDLDREDEQKFLVKEKEPGRK